MLIVGEKLSLRLLTVAISKKQNRNVWRGEHGGWKTLALHYGSDEHAVSKLAFVRYLQFRG